MGQWPKFFFLYFKNIFKRNGIFFYYFLIYFQIKKLYQYLTAPIPCNSVANQKELLLRTPSDFDEFWLWFQACNDYVSFSLGPPFKQLKK